MSSFLTLRNVVANQQSSNVLSATISSLSYSNLSGSSIRASVVTSGSLGFSTLTGSSIIYTSVNGTSFGASSIVGSTLMVNDGMAGINSKNEITGKATLYFYNNPYMTGGNTAAKTAILTEAVNYYTQSNLHFCLNTAADLTTSAALSDARLSILRAGNVGIGVAAPSAKLHIAGDATNAILLQLNEIKITGNGNSHWSIFGARSGHTYFSIANTSVNDVMGTAGTDVLCITSGNNIGIGTSGPVNKLDIQTEARSGTHNTNRGLYVTTGGAGTTDGMAEFRHSNGTQGVGIGYNGIYATGSSTNQDLQFASRGTGTINLLNDALASGYIKQNGSGKIYCFLTDTTTSFSSWFAFGNTAQANIGNCFNTSTRRFTAPVNGVYMFSFNGFTINESHVGLAFNTDYVDSNTYYTTQQWAIGSGSYARGTWIMYLNANDYIRCIIYNSGTLTTNRTYFTGTLVQAYT